MAVNFGHLQLSSAMSSQLLLHQLRDCGPGGKAPSLMSWHCRNGGRVALRISCSSSNGRVPKSAEDVVKGVEQLLEEKRRAELSARIASGAFKVDRPG